MASDTQTIVEPVRHPDAEAPFGERDDKILKGSFPMSPVMYTNDPDNLLTDEKLRNMYYDIIKKSEVRPKMEESPDMIMVALNETGGEGKPSKGKTLGNVLTGEVAQHWPIPNPGSSFNSNSSTGATPNDQSAFSSILIQPSINYGSGPSQPMSPNKTTVTIHDQDFRLGRLTKGSSS